MDKKTDTKINQFEEATITPDMIGIGSPAKSSIKPVGLGVQAQGHARGYLVTICQNLRLSTKVIILYCVELLFKHKEVMA